MSKGDGGMGTFEWVFDRIGDFTALAKMETSGWLDNHITRYRFSYLDIIIEVTMTFRHGYIHTTLAQISYLPLSARRLSTCSMVYLPVQCVFSFHQMPYFLLSILSSYPLHASRRYFSASLGRSLALTTPLPTITTSTPSSRTTSLGPLHR